MSKKQFTKEWWGCLYAQQQSNAASGQICSKAACAAWMNLYYSSLGCLWTHSSVLKSVLHVGVCLACSSLCFMWIPWSRAAFAVPGGIYGLQQLVLHVDFSVYKTFSGVFVYKSVRCTWTSLFIRAFVLHLDDSVFKSLCCTCACLSTRAFCCIWTWLKNNLNRFSLSSLLVKPKLFCLIRGYPTWQC